MYIGGVAPSRPRAEGSHMTLGMGVAESVLNKRIRFEARVLTQSVNLIAQCCLYVCLSVSSC